jgi:hypothetical protein
MWYLTFPRKLMDIWTKQGDMKRHQTISSRTTTKTLHINYSSFLKTCRSLQDSAEGRAISAMLPGLICASYLERLRASDFNPLHPDMLVPPHAVAARLQVNMLKSSWTKRIWGHREWTPNALYTSSVAHYLRLRRCDTYLVQHACIRDECMDHHHHHHHVTNHVYS